MQLADSTFRLNLTTSVKDPFPVATGSIEVGSRILQRFPESANFAIASKIFFGDDGDKVKFHFDAYDFIEMPFRQAQTEFLTCAGTITTTGNLIITVTSSLLSSPRHVAVPVVAGDNADAWKSKAMTALNADEVIRTHFTLSSKPSGIQVWVKLPTYNDSTLNVAVANGTAAGATPVTNSINERAGVHGVQIEGYNGNGKDPYGQPLPYLPYIHALLINVLSGPPTSSLQDVGQITATQSTLRPGSSYIVTNIPTTDLAAEVIELQRTGTGNTPLCVELVIIGGPTPN